MSPYVEVQDGATIVTPTAWWQISFELKCHCCGWTGNITNLKAELDLASSHMVASCPKCAGVSFEAYCSTCRALLGPEVL